MLNYTDPVLETNVMGVDFVNPFGLSAGLDKNCEMPGLAGQCRLRLRNRRLHHLASLPGQRQAVVPSSA